MPNIFQLVQSKVGSSIWGGVKSAAKFGYKGSTAGPIGRAAFGAGVGAAAGYFSSDYESGTLTAGSMIRGAALGGMLGFGTAMAPKLLKVNQKVGAYSLGVDTAPRMNPGMALGVVNERPSNLSIFSASPIASLGRTEAKGIWSGTKQALRAGRFGLENPLLVGGAIGTAAVGMSVAGSDGQSFQSPTMGGAQLNAKYDKQAIAAEELQMSQIAPTGAIGTAPQMVGRMQKELMDSTRGLVQGLHRGRH